MSGQRSSDAGKRDRGRRPFVDALGAAFAREEVAVDDVSPDGRARRRERDRQRALGHAVDGKQALSRQPGLREAIGEVVERREVDGLGAVEGEPPAREVDPLERALGEPSSEDAVREIGGARERRPETAHGPEPRVRSSHERLRGHDERVDPQVEPEQQAADETHVVVQRRPRQRAIVRAETGALGARAQVRHQVPVSHDDSLGGAGAAGRVLDERRLVEGAVEPARGRRRARGRDPGARVDASGTPCPELSFEAARRVDDDDPGVAVRNHPADTLSKRGWSLEVREGRQRHGDRSERLRREEERQERRGRAEAQDHPIARLDALPVEIHGGGADEGVDFAERERHAEGLPAEKRDLGERDPGGVREGALRERGGERQPGVGHEGPCPPAALGARRPERRVFAIGPHDPDKTRARARRTPRRRTGCRPERGDERSPWTGAYRGTASA